MAVDEGRIPPGLGERDPYYRVVIKYIHDHITRLVTIIATDEIWLSAKLLEWVPAYDDAENSSITNENLVAEREVIDAAIQERLNPILDVLSSWSGLTATDRNTFKLHERATSNVHHTVVNRAPVTSILGQSHLGAEVEAKDPDNRTATKLPDGVFMVLWTGDMITDPPTPNPPQILLGWSTSIEADLHFPLQWLHKDCNIEAFYIDKHQGKSSVSGPIPITPI